MQLENISITLTPNLYRQFARLKTQGQFANDQDLLQACFEALERSWERGSRDVGLTTDAVLKPYMTRPGLGVDDYDT